MHRHQRFIALFCFLALFIGACNKAPDHRRYIPKDAAVVAGINLKSLGKTIAWNMITGSKLFKEMEKRVPRNNGNDIMSGIDKAGIDPLNTFYVYLKTDKRYLGGIKVAGLVPLNDAGEWESFVKKNFPQAEITSDKGIKATCLGSNMYVGWNSSLLIIMNPLEEQANSKDAFAKLSPDMVAEIGSAFSVTEENSVKQNVNFEKLESASHDLSLWINYEQIMNQYMGDGNAARMGGLSLSPAIWKETGLACGFDFKKGKITGDLTWHYSKDMDSVYKEFGTVSVDKDMIAHLPASGMDMMAALHLSTKGIKTLLDKTDLLGLANAGLQTQGMDADNFLDAFTGDMALVMNDLKVQSAVGQTDWAGGQMPKTEATMSYVMKINNKDNFRKLMSIANGTGEMFPKGEGYFIPLTASDSLFIIASENYLVVSNKYASASNISKGGSAIQQLPDNVAAKGSSYPFNMYVDIQQAFKNIDLGSAVTADDAVVYEESKKLLTNMTFNGGRVTDNAMETHLEINFSNTEESSIITLLDFGMKISDAVEKAREKAQPKVDTVQKNS